MIKRLLSMFGVHVCSNFTQWQKVQNSDIQERKCGWCGKIFQRKLKYKS